MPGLAEALDLMSRRKPPMACCRRCEEPLISTIVFRYYEFYCLCCGTRWGFLDPAGREVTPELDAREAELRAEWDEHVAGKIIIEGREQHANPDALAAHNAALAWLTLRAGQDPPSPSLPDVDLDPEQP
jgi:hypothetical protein